MHASLGRPLAPPGHGVVRSFGLHFLILYILFFASAFGIVALSFTERLLVLVLAFPVIITDEVLKLVRRCVLRLNTSSIKLKAH